jgi:hypothetical protein
VYFCLSLYTLLLLSLFCLNKDIAVLLCTSLFSVISYLQISVWTYLLLICKQNVKCIHNDLYLVCLLTNLFTKVFVTVFRFNFYSWCLNIYICCSTLIIVYKLKKMILVLVYLFLSCYCKFEMYLYLSLIYECILYVYFYLTYYIVC